MINMLALFGTEAVAFWTLFGGLCAVGSNIVLQLVIALCGYCYSIFRGMTRMQYTSSSGTEEIGTADFAYKLITNDAIQKLFTTLLIVAIILLVLSVIVKTITSEFNFQKDGNAKSKILFDAVKALALFIVVPIVSILGLMLANFLLGVIITALESTIGIAEWFNFTNLLEGIVGNVGWGSALNAVLSILGVMNFIMIGCMWPVAKNFWAQQLACFNECLKLQCYGRFLPLLLRLCL